MRARIRVVAGAGAAACVAAAVALAVAPTARADAPVRTGWWNSASAGGSALPQPTTAAGDLHVANAPSGPGAIAAVFYQLLTTGPASATLELKITGGSAVGTPAVMACPTKSTSWKGGDDRPWSEAPGYSCTRHANGIASADGTSLTFLLDDALASRPGTFSLALVPAPGGVAPFSVDFTKPGFDSLMVTQDAAGPATPGGNGDAAAPPAAASGPQPAAGSAAAGGAPATPPLELPSTGPETAPADTGGSAPVVAGAPGSTGPSNALPATPAAAMTASDDRGRNLAIVALLVLAVALGRGSAGVQRQPQPIGRLRRRAPTPAPAPIAVTPRVGGIGRFAKARTTPARPLI